jgi:hypothetical protein
LTSECGETLCNAYTHLEVSSVLAVVSLPYHLALTANHQAAQMGVCGSKAAKTCPSEKAGGRVNDSAHKHVAKAPKVRRVEHVQLQVQHQLGQGVRYQRICCSHRRSVSVTLVATWFCLHAGGRHERRTCKGVSIRGPCCSSRASNRRRPGIDQLHRQNRRPRAAWHAVAQRGAPLAAGWRCQTCGGDLCCG